MPRRVNLFDFNFISEADISEVVDEILTADSYEENGNMPFLITPNVDDIVKFSKPENSYLREYFLKSSYILPDGHPIIWASMLFNKKIKNRLPGSDLLPLVWKKAIAQGFKVIALTSSELISEKLKAESNKVYCYSLPFFDKDDKTLIEKITSECVEILLENDIKIVVIGISFPKQNIIAIELLKKFKIRTDRPAPLFCMLGASFEFYLNIKSRAPKFVQKIGLEWLHRFSKEPKRLFRRYFIDDLAFFSIVFREFRKQKMIKKIK